jgi:hypothetical protein
MSFFMSLGTIFLFLEGFWRLVGMLVITWARLGWLNYHRITYHIVLSLRTLLLALLTALMSLLAIRWSPYGEPSWTIFVFAGGIVMVIAHLQTLYSRQSIHYGIERPMEQNYLFAIIAIIAYAVFISIPGFTNSLASPSIRDLVASVYSLKYLRNLLNIAGALYFIWTMYSGVVIITALINILLKNFHSGRDA